ncbi:MAG TPA: DUF2007 domain-containing protein [Terriglobales bacterium]|jgi:hypothetical protein|nr:DUF2007 domain-containing protein [Terriglobales bacterium]
MPAADPTEERRRLARFYAAMTDGELEKLADEADSLTELARDALEDELDRRGLDDIPEAPVGATDQVESRKLIAVRKFRDLPEALLAKGALESAGIECFLADDNLVRLDWFISNFIGGVKLLVDRNDADAAANVLNQPIPEGFEVHGVGEYLQPRCPKCYSLDIAFEDLNKPVAYTTAYFGVPIPYPRRSWKCNTCGRRWQDVNSEEEDPAV